MDNLERFLSKKILLLITNIHILFDNYYRSIFIMGIIADEIHGK